MLQQDLPDRVQLLGPPAASIGKIDNAESIARASDRVWFTEWTANYVGFVSDSYKPPFSISLASNSTVGCSLVRLLRSS